MSPLRGLLFVILLVAVVAIWVLTCVSERFEQVASGVRALDPKSFETLTVTTAGTGAIRSWATSCGSARSRRTVCGFISMMR